MTFSPLANMRLRIPPHGRQSRRLSQVRGFTIHHQAGVDAHGQASAPGREVSANYWITNAGVIIPNVDETMRAWTTGAPGYPGGAESDHRNITVEVSNSPEGVRTGSWAISNAAQDALERLIGDVFRRYRLGPVKRGTHGGVAVHQDFVPTACPGPYIMRNLNTIIASAERHRAGTKPKPKPDPIEEDEEMSRNVCVATEGRDSKNKKTYYVRVFSLETGEEHQFSTATQSYIRNVALTYGCAPQVPVSYITKSHYDAIGRQLSETRKRLDARK